MGSINKLVEVPVTDPQLPQMSKKDYIYCEDCNEFSDFWKYGHDIKAAGHDGHNWRYVTEEELKSCIEDCLEKTPYCPKCDCIIDFEVSHGQKECSSCGWPIVEEDIVYRNCFEEN